MSQTQKQQMVVMLGGMVVAFVGRRPSAACPSTCRSATRSTSPARSASMNAVELRLRPRAAATTFWSGLTGGFFLALSYFGTDQSQVQRYLSGRSVTESRLGLLFNGLLKIPMQFLILFVGVMVFVFYQFNAPPLFFNEPELRRACAKTPHGAELRALEASTSAARSSASAQAVRALTSPRSTRRRRGRDRRRGARRGVRGRRRDADGGARARRKALIEARAAAAPRPRTPTTSSSPS